MTRTMTLLFCTGLLVASYGCRSEKTTDKSSGGQAHMAGATMDPARPASTMDFSLPPGAPGKRTHASERPAASARRATPAPAVSPPGALEAALADLDLIQTRQKQVAKQWLAINTLADARKRGTALLKGSLDVLALTISSMRKAVTLSAADLKTFLARQNAHRVQTRKLNQSIHAKQKQIKAIPGGQAFFDKLKQEATVKVRKHSKTLMQLGRQLLARKKEL